MSVALAALISDVAPVELPIQKLPEVNWFSAMLELPAVKALLPLPIMLIITPAIWWFFRDTWRAINAEAAEERRRLPDDYVDYRPMVCLVLVAMLLTLQEYYGGRQFYVAVLKPELESLQALGLFGINVDKYSELYGYAWWAVSRVIGYVMFPLLVWKLAFPQDKLLDMGLRLKGITEHWRTYALCLGIVMVLMVIVAQQPDFGAYYPFYKLSSRSWFDFLVWEAMYWAQFFALELFFRGWMLQAMRRTMGVAAIFVMSVPYCMIHYGKPYLEAHGAVVAGIVLGSLAMQTRSIYAGFLVHITVAVGMDLLSLYKRGVLPTVFWG